MNNYSLVAWVRLHLESYRYFFAKKILIQLEEIQRTVTKNDQGLKRLIYEESLEELEMYSLPHR